ncbi:membrane lipoprotein lipid attachment site-containing protein [Alkalihalophilus lindianensis]|uniref:Membrane lipoprotein lipid attachment site-containing protein n=1 Tax=Alkalihalophilus lindianensis TaxID=1630542 RepID=A0ABU3X4U7_9BACI|nr:membrane lipoprotein lipid attachment site-containing protein [Alkalihalophilus lindianensis]MDV2682899.1 membrane lipoprotein lipid attachment site-containing protein [Alkalihalophilus lindianensis]
MKKTIMLLFTLLVLAGCNVEENPEDYTVIWGESHNADLHESAIKRLEDAKIKYRMDENNQMLIKEKDLNKAVMCCS